jgi:TRAP-type mannitol/chloroaromatic compound transport system substrate-binding protein
MQRRSFFRNVAAVGVVPIAIIKNIYPKCTLAKEKRQWQMVTQFRVNAKQQEFARIIAEASDGQLQIRLNSKGSDLPSKIIEDVSSGKVEMAWGNFLYSPSESEGIPRVSKVPAADFLIMPFGLTAQEYNSWIEYGGGLELVDTIYEQIGCKYFPAGNTGMQMGGWFAKEINTIEDFKGLRIRISGFGAAVLKAVGAEPYDVAPWSNDARSALIEHKLDAFERGNPASDLTAELYKQFKYYYYPAWHEPSVPFALSINRSKWDALPTYLKAIISTAARWLNYQWINEKTAHRAAALETLVKEHSVLLRRFPEVVLVDLARISDHILRERASKDRLSQEIFESITKFKQKASHWAMIALQSYLTARAHQ